MLNVQDFDVEEFIQELNDKSFVEMLNALYEKIQNYIPIHRIRCLYKGYSETAIHCYYGVPEEKENIYNLPELLPEILRSEIFITNINRYLYINDLVNDNSAFSKRILKIFPGAKSILQFPFFITSKNYFFLSMSSDVVNIFNYENISKLLEVTKYLKNIFAEQYFASENFYENILNSENMLEMCPDLAETNQAIAKVAKRLSTVLVLGETGVGKGVVAKAIHENSNFFFGPFVKVNCGAIPESLLESELFGYEKGAFTGAISSKPGFFEQANNGTIFLDEIGDLPLSAQTKLLHILEDQELRRVGGVKVIKLNLRIITATRHNLEEMVKEGKFRVDLWYRLNVYTIFIPPLRERPRDIAVLAKYFVKTKCLRENVEAPAINKESLIKLCQKNWEGNVRQLEHYIESLLIDRDYSSKNELDFEAKMPIENVLTEMLNTLFTVDNLPSLDQFNAAYIRSALNKFNWKVKGEKGAAKALGINPSTLKFRMKQLGVVKH